MGTIEDQIREAREQRSNAQANFNPNPNPENDGVEKGGGNGIQFGTSVAFDDAYSGGGNDGETSNDWCHHGHVYIRGTPRQLLIFASLLDNLETAAWRAGVICNVICYALLDICLNLALFPCKLPRCLRSIRIPLQKFSRRKLAHPPATSATSTPVVCAPQSRPVRQPPELHRHHCQSTTCDDNVAP